MEWFEVIREFGVEVACLIFAGFIIWYLLKYILNETTKVNDSNAKMIENYTEMLETNKQLVSAVNISNERIEGKIDKVLDKLA